MPTRKNIRLKNYDYSQNGLYFITICAYKKSHLFGKVEHNKMILNENGEIVNKHIATLSKHYKNIEIEIFTVMPNHIHLIININSVRDDLCRGDACSALKLKESQSHQPITPPTVANIVRGLKSGISKEIGFSVWQRNYFEHIIRNNESYHKISEYIEYNPTLWEKDCYNN